MKIIYFCNLPRTPSGGTNVIYRHVQQLNNMGIPAVILPSRRGIKHQQSLGHTPFISDNDINENDYFIIPEISAAEIASTLIPHSLGYGIFVQNGHYLSHRARRFSEQDVDNAYQHASHIFAISNSTSAMIKLHYPNIADRIQRMVCSMDLAHFYIPAQKEKIISYMPRKNSHHANALAFALKKHIPSDWQLVAIDKLSPEEAAKILRKSAIFLSFSNLEGLGLPPIEAALCGNYVIGYHGNGGLDYWCAPNFETIDVGDLTDFVEKVTYRIAEIERDSSLASLQRGLQMLQQTYSLENEKRHLQQLGELAKASAAGKSSRCVSLRMQNRASFFHSLLGRRHTRNRKSGWQTSDV